MNRKYFKYPLHQFIYVVLGLILTTLLSTTDLYAISNTSPATPSSTPFVGVNSHINFQYTIPPTGAWTSTSTPLPEGTSASYAFPQISTPCNLSRISSITVSIPTTAINLAPGTTQNLSGIMSSVVNINDNSLTPVNVSAVTQGTVFLPAWGSSNQVVRGITDDLMTVADSLIPGPIEYTLNTTGMTVAQYNALAVNVYHDLLDPPNGFVNSISTSQPIVSVTTDDTPCFISANNDNYNATTNQPLVISPNDGVKQNDMPQDSSVAIQNQPTHGTVNLNPDGSFTYTPNKDYVGQDTFTYTLTDTHGNTAVATVTIAVSAVPAVPNAGKTTKIYLVMIFSAILAIATLTIHKIQRTTKKS